MTRKLLSIAVVVGLGVVALLLLVPAIALRLVN